MIALTVNSIISEVPLDTMPSSLHNSDSSQDKDEICQICKQWGNDDIELETNFISCDTCVHSYHKRCIPVIYHTKDESYNCYEMKDKKRNKALLCCTEPREPLLLYSVTEPNKTFEATQYIIDKSGNDIECPNTDAIKHRLFLNKHNKSENNSEIFTRTKCNGVTYKGTNYVIGDSIQIRSDPDEHYQTKVAIIKDIYTFSEPNTLPQFGIFWYWRERECANEIRTHFGENKASKLRIPNAAKTDKELKCVDSHLFIDIENEQKICIAAVLHKVIICDSFHRFVDLNDANLRFKDFGNVFYCNASFTIANFANYQSSPFERIQMTEFTKTLIGMSQRQWRQATKPKKMIKKRNKFKNESIEKVQKWIEMYDSQYRPGNDDCACMDLRQSAKNGSKNTHLPLQNGRKLILDEIHGSTDQIVTHTPKTSVAKTTVETGTKSKKKKPKFSKQEILAQNKRKICISDQNKMREICTRFGIKNGMKIDITLYGFETHLSVYDTIAGIVRVDSESERSARVKAFNGNKLRDIHSKIKSEGKLGRKQEMICGICKKLSEFRVSYLMTAESARDSTEDIEMFDGNDLKNQNKNRKRKRPKIGLFDLSLNGKENKNNKSMDLKRRKLGTTQNQTRLFRED